MSTITVGADPEYFIRKGNEVIPCVGIFPGSKDEPTPLASLMPDKCLKLTQPARDTISYGGPNLIEKPYKSGYFIHEDNVMVELGVPPASETKTASKIMGLALKNLMYLLEQKGLSLAPAVEETFPASAMNSRQAQLIGCEADYSAYDGGAVRSNVPDPGLLRTCGGHVHVGGKFNCPPFVAALFLEATLFARDRVPLPNSKSSRVSWYRQPGVFRPKPYGIEYRTLSSAWTRNSTARMAVYGSAMSVGKFLQDSNAESIKEVFSTIDWGELQAVLSRVTKNSRAVVLRDDIFQKLRGHTV